MVGHLNYTPMERVILQTKYMSVTFDDENNLFMSIYHRETQNMTDKEWQEHMILIKQLVEMYEPTHIIDDNRERLYDYSPDMQVWTLTLFIDSWNKIGLKKYAHIFPNEIIGKITSEQIVEFAQNDFLLKFQYQFVNDYQSAIDWINASE